MCPPGVRTQTCLFNPAVKPGSGISSTLELGRTFKPSASTACQPPTVKTGSRVPCNLRVPTCMGARDMKSLILNRFDLQKWQFCMTRPVYLPSPSSMHTAAPESERWQRGCRDEEAGLAPRAAVGGQTLHSMRPSASSAVPTPPRRPGPLQLGRLPSRAFKDPMFCGFPISSLSQGLHSALRSPCDLPSPGCASWGQACSEGLLTLGRPARSSITDQRG